MANFDTEKFKQSIVSSGDLPRDIFSSAIHSEDYNNQRNAIRGDGERLNTITKNTAELRNALSPVFDSLGITDDYKNLDRECRDAVYNALLQLSPFEISDKVINDTITQAIKTFNQQDNTLIKQIKIVDEAGVRSLTEAVIKLRKDAETKLRFKETFANAIREAMKSNPDLRSAEAITQFVTEILEEFNL